MSIEETGTEHTTETVRVVLLPEDGENFAVTITAYDTGPELYALVDMTPEKADTIAAGLTAWAKVERAKLGAAPPSSAEEAPADGR